MAFPYQTEPSVERIVQDYIGDKLGTKVVPNPPISGTETHLNGLKIDGTTYRIAGHTLYKHTFNVEGMIGVSFSIVNTEDQPYTNLTPNDVVLYGSYSSSGFTTPVLGICSTPNGNKLCIMQYNQTTYQPEVVFAGGVELTGLTDTVIEL